MLVNPFKSLLIALIFSGMIFSGYAYSHGIIENPPSREYFCGKITRPHDVESKELAYEECRPILKKDGVYNNDLYQFMSVLSHSRGYYKNSNLPLNVCGYDSETFKGGPSPWDAAINWPVNKMTPGQHEFVWDISWGPHFSDTEEFKYWITKPDFKFSPDTAVKWSDIEEEPFCDIPWNDNDPSKNPSTVWADRENAKFHNVCTVPARQGRHIIYAEWGRTPSTDERFHACIDVNFTDQDVQPVEAKIAPLPIKEYYGSGVIELNGAQSVGDNLKYEWVVNSPDSQLYTLSNSDQPQAVLTFGIPAAEQQVSVTLRVSNTEGSSNAEIKFMHMPEVQTNWIDLGPLTHEPQTLKVGDKVSVRGVQQNGADLYFPSTPLVITESLTAPEAWPMALAQEINKEQSPIMVGVLGEGGDVPIPKSHATENRIYATNTASITATILNAYLEIKPASTETPPGEIPPGEIPPGEPPHSDQCTMSIQSGNSEWWAGIEVGTDMNHFVLDFSHTGLDLSKVNLDKGVFQASIEGQLVRVTEKPNWVNLNTKGYLGFNASNYPALKNFQLPTCQAE